MDLCEYIRQFHTISKEEFQGLEDILKPCSILEIHFSLPDLYFQGFLESTSHPKDILRHYAKPYSNRTEREGTIITSQPSGLVSGVMEKENPIAHLRDEGFIDRTQIPEKV